MGEWINSQAKCNHTALVVNACMNEWVSEWMSELNGHEWSDGYTMDWKGYLNEWVNKMYRMLA